MALPKTTLRILLLATAALAAWACRPPGSATPDDAMRGLVVVGTGEARGEPDMARVDVGVMVRAATAADATEQASARARSLVAALEALGVSGPDVRTRHVSVHEERNDWGAPPRPMEGPDAPATTPRADVPASHFVAQNMLEITVRDLDALGRILAAATEVGANQMHGVRLELADPQPLVHQARERAVADAKAQAEQLATLSGVKLGPLVAVRAIGTGEPRPMRLAAEQDMATSVPIERGELTVTEQVELRFALRP